jgi:protoheme IX farnesyltransferase
LLAGANQDSFDAGLFLATLAGIALVIAAACVFNNYVDRGIDAKMARTKRRALVSGLVSGPMALTYASVLGLLGFIILAAFTNLLTVLLGGLALFMYVVAYGYFKRRSVHGTLVGTIPGALPPVAGYTAVTGRLDGGALILFLILVAWQMPHFYAIAIFRFDDYKAAGLPVLPVKRGIAAAKLQIIAYIAAFIAACALLTIFGYAGYTYLLVMTALGLYWLRLSLKGFKARDSKLWARQMFFFSLIIITALSIMLPLGAVLP